MDQYGDNILRQSKILDLESEFRSAIFNYRVFVEYKSSIKEWGKQVDQFLRQIKTKIKMQRIDTDTDFVAVISFDSAFEDFEHILNSSGIDLIILPDDFLHILSGKNKEDKLQRLKEYLAEIEEDRAELMKAAKKEIDEKKGQEAKRQKKREEDAKNIDWNKLREEVEKQED